MSASSSRAFQGRYIVQFEGVQRRCDLLARKCECEQKRVGERLAAVRERAAHDLFEALPVAHVDERRLKAMQDHDRRDDLRPREKLSRRNVERALDAHRDRQRHGQAAVGGGPRFCEQAVGHVLLNHRHDALGRTLHLGERDQKRRGDIIGEVAGDAPRQLAAVLRIIEFQRVAVLDVRGREIVAGTQDIDEAIVEIEGREIGPGGQQRRGERTGSGADFEHPVAGCVDRQPRDAGRRAGVHEEVLAERLLGTQPASTQECPRIHELLSTGVIRRR